MKQEKVDAGKIPFLPKTKREEGTLAGPQRRGMWEPKDSLMEKLANSLDIEGNVTADVLTAIPTVWARPLLFAEALFGVGRFDERLGKVNNQHPLHQSILDEWRGLMGVFCFKDYYGLEVTAKPYKASDNASDPFGKILHTLCPDVSWDTVSLIYVDGELIGGTSPQTLFFTAPEYRLSNSIPWRTKGRLADPVVYFTAFGKTEEMILLRTWLNRVGEDVATASLPGDRDGRTRNAISSLLKQWAESIQIERRMVGIEFGDPVIPQEPYRCVSRGAKRPGRFRSDFLLDSRKDTSPHIVVWERGWEHVDKMVYAPYGPAEVPLIKEPYVGELLSAKIPVPAIRPELYFFTNKLLKLPVDKERVLIAYRDDYIPPLRTNILRFFSPDDVKKMIEWREKGDGVEVVLRLPVKAEGGAPSALTPAVVSKFYGRRDIEEIATAPRMAVWPNTRFKNWKHYYLICEKSDRINVKPFVNESLNDSRRANSTVWKLATYPDVVAYYLPGNDEAGLLFPQQPAEEKDIGADQWVVAVDFGTSNTSVFYRQKSEGSNTTRLPIRNRCVPLTRRGQEDWPLFLFAEFFPFPIGGGKEVAGIFPSIFRSLRSVDKSPEPILDGIVQFDEPNSWPAAYEGRNIRENLKWSTDARERMFISTFLNEVILLVGAEARDAGVKSLTLRWSYPSAFAPKMLNDFHGVWNNLLVMGKEMGLDIALETPEAESVAVCKYMRKVKGATPLADKRAQVIVDIGGGTSDVAVWLKGKIKAHASILLAGGIVSQYAKRSPEFAEEICRITGHKELKNGIQERPSAMLNLILKHSEDKLTQALAAGHNIAVPFQRARSLILFASSAIFYYVGLILKYIEKKGDVIEGCDVYLAGNGGKLLRWISPNEEAVGIALSNIIHNSAERLKIRPSIIISFPDHAKEEVARGLAEDLQLVDAGSASVQLVGELGYTLEGKSLAWDIDVNKQRDILDYERLRVPDDFPLLKNFLVAYDGEAERIGLTKIGKLYDASAIKAGVEQRVGEISQFKRQDMALVQPLFIEEVKVVADRMIAAK